MRLPVGVSLLALLLLVAPPATAQEAVTTSLAMSGAGAIVDLTDTATKSIPISIQFSAEQGFACTASVPITVEVTVTVTGPITASVDNSTLSYTIPSGHGTVLQPYRGEAQTLLTVTRTAPHEEAEARVTATFAGAEASSCVPSTFGATNASTPVRTTALGSVATPNITILSPANNATGSSFNMVVSVANFELKPVPTTPGKVAGQGHIHYLVDGKNPEGEYATHQRNYTFSDLAPGNHTLRAELVNHDHTPLDPPVFAEIRVTATADDPTNPTSPTRTTPTRTTGTTPTGATPNGDDDEENGIPGPSPLLLVALLGASALALRRARRGA